MENTNKPKVELIGRDGNAFAIMATCKKAMRTSKWTVEKQKEVLDEMMAGNYDHLLQTALKYFDVVGADDEVEGICNECGDDESYCACGQMEDDYDDFHVVDDE